jgi:hypothetical protein
MGGKIALIVPLNARGAPATSASLSEPLGEAGPHWVEGEGAGHTELLSPRVLLLLQVLLDDVTGRGAAAQAAIAPTPTRRFVVKASEMV